ncbi:MAG TPA: 5-methyltetrahydropteroyltriglutamate--homocysteine S-methyltransferase [Spirochaetota bacterium]|nr:5-methyltetrahydropteroyltriglutamate--homocysteine S-methyltransferase [Spirochaetota bacterium]HQE59656.1 5-methyltetrahydropteroyltriglutamate--homocysteine S-methyltransferase [Spirochaetota bacterium]
MQTKRIKSFVTGFPRIGEKRELKKALEEFWDKKTEFSSLEAIASQLRKRHWNYQKDAGIDFISSNDFSYYDQMLDMCVMLNAVPERFAGISSSLERYFAMARGNESSTAMEMTKWLNTNYHYIVPELSAETVFRLNPQKIISEYTEAKSAGIKTKINIIGPLSFLGLAKTTDGSDNFKLLEKIIPLYKELIIKLSELDKEVYLQFDEPLSVKDPSPEFLSLIKQTYQDINSVCANVKIILVTYFDHASETVAALKDVPLYAIGLDFVYGKENLNCLNDLNGKILIAGIIDGRNIWKSDYSHNYLLLKEIEKYVPKENIIVSTSCSLLHVPYSLEYEEKLDSHIKEWMSFAKEKLREVSDTASIFDYPDSDSSILKLKTNGDILKSKIEFLKNTLSTESNKGKGERSFTFDERISAQKKILNLPVLPTTTIGSFPQTAEIRKLRNDYKAKRISQKDYEEGIKNYISECVKFQEEAGLDVLVHGEPERNDMVEYFGEQMEGFVFTQNGWVQSYGSRCVKPPVIYGNVSRPRSMTVDIISYAQSCTKKVMKGMLTGPVTILNWSFVRNDIDRSAVCSQIASAICREVSDLQSAGIKIIQVDEAAFKEGYPLRKEKVSLYEKWAVESFKRAVSSAEKETQIHTHMCYSDFNSIIGTLEKMDADVITIETSRSGNKLLNVFAERGYKNEIGPGVYDIHSPRIPLREELEHQIKMLIKVIPAERLWINPDCGLKTRKWEEVKPSLKNMVDAVMEIRKTL